MTNIEPTKNTTISAVAQNTKVKREQVAKPESSQGQTTPQVDSSGLRSEMSRWFAQAGVQPGKKVGLEQDDKQRLARRQQIMKQRKLSNLEQILEMALDFCPPQGSPEKLDPDWFFSFVNLAEEIYSPAMQELWAKIFSVETATPGSFSLRSLQVLKQLTQKDALLFKQAVNMASRRRGDYSPKILCGFYQKPSLLSFLSIPRHTQLNLTEFGLTYPGILSLIDMGLIYNSEIESGEIAVDKKVEWISSNHHYFLAVRKPNITLNYYKFTSTGAELAKLISVKVQEPYLNALKSLLKPAFEVS